MKRQRKKEVTFGFPQALEENPVQISWSTGKPDILSWEGIPQEGISEKGESVEVAAFLSLGEVTDIWNAEITVYPPKLNEREKMQKEIQKEAELLSENPSGPYIFPNSTGRRNSL